ncbi:FAD-dependent oxidoreductase [Zunongwangia sp. HGR-M22]|uniref:FAD-dependent oxidoreductase n=1 Tax=Zunongwangia sp. HGR-M22 TaxID=3015168 RepID=UPI0022DD2671|nr:FAD-dependent oxidoreductase [Zunongwangia sp. HGR-M22]WBL25905.1 FAD-dependent oxidoreductase [Zunongwangia sp. HGR-M22]
MEYDLLIVGGGAAAMSCALVIGSALEKEYAKDKKIGIVLHQKSSDLQNALFNNVLGLKPGTEGRALLEEGPRQLEELYPKVDQLKKEKLQHISKNEDGIYELKTNKETYLAKKVVIAIGYSDNFRIGGLDKYVMPHKKAKASKNRIQLMNEDHLVIPDLYVAGSLAGWRSQYSIACGSGAAVATDILTDWNDGEHTKVHDKLF